MNRRTQFLGIAGLVFLVFAAIIQFLVAYDEYHFIPAHFVLGLVLLVFFTLRGGLQALRSVAAKRTAGFGARVTLFSALFLGVLVVINGIGAKHELFRYDSTAEKVYTLSPETKKILDNLTKTVRIRAFYLGGKIDDPGAKDLLDRMERYTNKVKVEVIDPEKKPTLVEKYGISQSSTLHFSFDGEDSKRETKVMRDIGEQEIANAFIKLTRGGEKIVYALQGHGEADLTSNTEAGFLFLKEAIQGENIAVKELKFEGEAGVPEDASALLVLAPRKELLPKERAAIESYLHKGGNALFLNEPRTTTDIRDLVKPLGIDIGEDVVVDQVVRLFAGPGLGVQPMVTKYGEHPITKDFKENTIFSIASSVRRNGTLPAGAVVTELAFTSENSWAEKNFEMLFGEDPKASRDPDDIKGPVSLGAAFEGSFKLPGANDQSSAADKSRVVVIGDVDFVANVNLRQLYNRDFFLNSLNWVLGEDGQVTIRPRTIRKSLKGLTVEQFSAIFLFTAVLLPELILLGGLSVWWFRKK